MRLIADKAHANDTAAVALMLDLGFDPLVPGAGTLRGDPVGGVPRQRRDDAGAAAARSADQRAAIRSYGGTPLG